MSKKQIKSSLTELFDLPLKDGEKRKIIYWEDRDKTFFDLFNIIEINNVKKHILHDKNYFKTKYILEVEDTDSNYLIYTQETLSKDGNNWLLDNVLYSTVFYADEISVHSRDLGIPEELRKVVLDNKKFFIAAARRERLKSYNIDKFNEEIIEIAIISVLTNQRTLSFENSLRTILIDSLNHEENKYLKQIDGFFDLDKFWNLVEKRYGYKEGEKSLKMLLIYMMITTISILIGDEKLHIFKNFIGKTGKGNCTIFLDEWMNHKSDYKIYDKYAEKIEKEIAFSILLQTLEIDQIKEIDIFPSIDKAIILYIVDALENKLEDYEEYRKLLRLRKSKHFYKKYKYIYEGLYNCVKIFEFRKNTPSIPIEPPEDMLKSYSDKYYLMDLYYRKFYIAFDKNSSNHILQKLRDMVEGLYINWFMMDLSYAWSQSISNNLNNTWDIPGTVAQKDFYMKCIKPIVYDRGKIFVIILDALRYDVAVELYDRLDGENLGSVEITSLFSGSPSSIKFGMARLLPHENMELRENGFVYIDNINSGSMDGRKQILSNQTTESTVISYKTLLNMNTNEISKFYKGKNLNYIYYDTVDAIDDNAAAKIKTFDNTEMAIGEISKLVRDLINYGNATSIYITADNGSIYPSFVHGGATLQEVVIPLIHYRNKNLGQTGAVRPKKTQIKLTNTVRKITNNITTLNFFQTERVGGKILPCSVRVYLTDENGEIISNQEILLGDKTSEKPEDRNMSIRFILKQGNYDRNKDYYLIIKDVQTNEQYEKIKF